MICYSIRLLKITPEKADHVITALRRDGLFAELKKQIRGHIGCSILESDLTKDLYLVIDFWRSKYDFFESEISPYSIFLTQVLDRLAYQNSSLGPFSFPQAPNDLSEIPVDQYFDADFQSSQELEKVELVPD